MKTKRMLQPKYKLSGGPVFTFSLLGEEIRPCGPHQFRHCFSPM